MQSYDKILEKYRLDIPEANFYYIPDFVQNTDVVYSELLKNVEFSQGEVVVRGSVFTERRLTCLMSIHKDKPYTYSGKTSASAIMPDIVHQLRNILKERINVEFDTCLANYYRDGNDKISKHSDKETNLAINSPICSLSFGAVRQFNIYPKREELKEYILKNADKNKDIYRVTDIGKIYFNLANGSMLLMGLMCQKNYYHEVPEQKRITEGRINLTFRQTK